jgi:predicted esterase
MIRLACALVLFLFSFAAVAAAPAEKKLGGFSGLWLTDLGLMELDQSGNVVTGKFALRGVSTIEGTATGNKLEFTFKAFKGGKGSFQLAANGTSFTGSATDEGSSESFNWNGRRASEFVQHAKLIPGKIVDGSTRGLLTYCVRAPIGYKPGDAKKWPTILILHGSNMNAKAYLNTIATAWPDIARDYLLIGINGERPSNLGKNADDAAFNYTNVSYVGHSTFKGFPGTDRESPALVSEAMAELRDLYPIKHYFVGGHSQGGFLTYSLMMNFPEMIAGAFPISCGVIFQCEPTAYQDEKVRAAQRAVPLAIIHSKQDPVVTFSTGEYAATIFGEANWPAFRFFADNSGAAHMFARLPVRDAIRWLEAQSSDDPVKLLDFADQRLRVKGYRDAIAALDRARSLKLDTAATTRADHLIKEIDAKAAPGAKDFLARIKNPNGKSWIDAFLAYRDEFEFAPAAHELMESFNTLRANHEKPAAKAMNDARAAFQQNNREQGYVKYQEVVDKYFAASSYRNAKRWLAERQ